MEHELIRKGYIPLDKSWMIRMGVLDLLHSYDDTIRFLEAEEQLSDDLQALHHASLAWNSNEPVDVGESATLYRFLRFASWKLGLDKEFIRQGTLIDRDIYNDPEIINYSLEDLLKLDNRTSQWASAAVLLGNEERIGNPPYKLQVTYEAVEHWKKQRANDECWKPRYDETILSQAVTYLELLEYGKTSFVPQQSEDYCFAYFFELISKEEGESRWPALYTHESNRISEAGEVHKAAHEGRIVYSRDPRVVEAYAMHQRVNNMPVNIVYRSAVNKNWPQFWEFLEDSPSLTKYIYTSDP